MQSLSEKGHIEKDCWENNPEKMPEKFQKKKDAKTEKSRAAVNSLTAIRFRREQKSPFP
jgi:hypothetical protein